MLNNLKKIANEMDVFVKHTFALGFSSVVSDTVPMRDGSPTGGAFEKAGRPALVLDGNDVKRERLLVVPSVPVA